MRSLILQGSVQATACNAGFATAAGICDLKAKSDLLTNNNIIIHGFLINYILYLGKWPYGETLLPENFYIQNYISCARRYADGVSDPSKIISDQTIQPLPGIPEEVLSYEQMTSKYEGPTKNSKFIAEQFFKLDKDTPLYLITAGCGENLGTYALGYSIIILYDLVTGDIQ